MSLSDTLLAAQHIDITEQSDGQSFVAALKTINDGLSQGQSEEPWGFAWWLRLGSDDDSPALVVGVRGKVGTLSWWEGEQEWRRRTGSTPKTPTPTPRRTGTTLPSRPELSWRLTSFTRPLRSL